MNTGNSLWPLKAAIATLMLWFAGMAALSSQEYLFDTQIINVEDGLPDRMLYSIVQDKESFIWLTTRGAISRYDGYGFKTYNYNFLNVPEDKPLHLAVDANNNLWYCNTIGHINNPSFSGVINTSKDSIYSMSDISGGRFAAHDVIYLSNTTKDSDNILIITRSGVVYNYDGTFNVIYRFPESLTKNIGISATSDGGHWCYANGELMKIKDGKKLLAIPIPNIHLMNRIVSDTPDVIVEMIPETTVAPIALYRYWKLEKDTFVPFGLAPHSPDELQSILRLHRDYNCYATDVIWARNTEGDSIYAFDDFEFPGTSPDFRSYNVFTDEQNTLWASTGNGLFKITVQQNPFTVFRKGNSTRGIYKDGNLLWTGGYIGNAVFEANDQTIKKKLPNDVMSFFKDHREHLLLAMSNKVILEYIPAEEKYISYKFKYKSPFRLIFQNAITKTYWIGTTSGLLRFDKAVGEIIPYPLLPGSEELDIRQSYQNSEGLWIITNQGVFLMDANKETLVKHYTTADGLPAGNIHYMYEDSEGIYWLATKGNGLIRWDRNNNRFRQYTKNEGLSNNTIYAIYEDDYNTLWLPSNYGLMAFDKITATTRVYLPQNGIAHEEFNTLSHFQDTDGTLYFGGLSGITSFHPKDLRSEKAASLPLYITKVRTLKKDAETFTDNTAAYTKTKTITLHPEDRMLDVEFTLLDYKNNTENQYAYKITGHQERWIYTTNNKISIMNPPYGRYQLIIKGRGASGQWSENVLNVPLHIKNPFYRKWWFIAILVFVTLASILFAIRLRTQKLQKDRERLEDEVRKRTQKIAQDREIIEIQAEELKALDKAKNRFFANITHEFRTPLTLIIGPAEQLLSSDLPKTARAKLQSMKRNSTQLLSLINQLLDLSKLENKKMHLEMAHDDLVACTRELLIPFQPLLDKKALQLHFYCPFQQWEVRFDQDKWSKMVNNLLSNAIKFTPQGGSISLSLQKQKASGGDTVQLRVTDTGIGIEAEKLPHIFNRFYQADASSTRMQEGSGIGLSLVKELAALQNGSIHVESAVEKGTVFTLNLPLVDEITAEIASTTEVPAPLPLSVEAQPKANTPKNTQEKSPARTLEVLIIEDNADMRAYIRSCIDETTYHITEAADGVEGIEKAQNLVPDLIISDVMMPQKDGFEVTHAIRSHIATSHIPLILLTAKASLESRLKGLERGADAYLTKPFSPEELVLRIQKLIELRQLLQQRYQNSEIPEENTTFQKEDAFIGELRAYILENISESDLSGERISRHFAMSRMQLYRKLKTLTNTSAGDFVRSIRLQTALQLLKAKELTIAEIAYETGFSSPSSFSKLFKKAYGKAPSQFG